MFFKKLRVGGYPRFKIHRPASAPHKMLMIRTRKLIFLNCLTRTRPVAGQTGRAPRIKNHIPRPNRAGLRVKPAPLTRQSASYKVFFLSKNPIRTTHEQINLYPHPLRLILLVIRGTRGLYFYFKNIYLI